jgi:hypothetical protein
MTLSFIDVDAFANIRSLLHSYTLSGERPSAVVDVQKEYLYFTFIKDKEFFLFHRLPMKQRTLEEPDDEGSDTASILLKELKRLIFGHRLGHGPDDLERLFITGNERAESVSRQVSASISVPVDFVQPFKRLHLSQEIAQSEEVLRHPGRFVTSVGVLLKRFPEFAGSGGQTVNGP